jgi:polyhydroxybutyrate depolymerase
VGEAALAREARVAYGDRVHAPMRRARVALVALAGLGAATALVGCEPRSKSTGGGGPPLSSTSVQSAASASAASTAPAPRDRPYMMHTPKGWDRARPAPLVVSLHGYGAPSGAANAHMLGLEPFADEQGFVVAYPDGRRDSRGMRFWSATDACCDFDHAGDDDVAYVSWLVDDVASKIPVDRARVYVVGYSNGGFLAHRLACDLAPRIAAVVSIGGAAWKDPSRCAPSEPVSVLEIHGEADDIVHFGGGTVFDLPGASYPGARDTVAMWAAKDGCAAQPHAGGDTIDFDQGVGGAETTRSTFAPCRDGVTVDLWSVVNGSHVPRASHAGLLAIWSWMQAHAKSRPR